METALHVVQWLLTIVSGAGFTYLVTNWAKISPLIPISEGQKAKVRTFAASAAAVASVILALVNPDIRPDDPQGLAVGLLTFAASWLGAHEINKAVK